MSSPLEPKPPGTLPLVIPETPRRSPWFWVLPGAFLAAVVAYAGWKAGLDPRRIIFTPTVELATLPVDEGSMVAVVTETGSLESANNATIRCQVEALMGLVGGAAGMQNGRPGQPGATGGWPGWGARPADSQASRASRASKGKTRSSRTPRRPR
jgi:hypothetical protein